MNRIRSTTRTVSGFTLVEVLIAVVIFGLMAGGIIGGILQGRRMAEKNVYHITALTVAQGYLEQMKGMSYGDLSTNSDQPIPTELNYGEPDPLFLNVWTEKRIDIHDTPDNPNDDMRMWFRPTVEEGAFQKRIQLDFRWEAPRSAGGTHTYEDSVRVIRSPAQ